MRLSAAAAVLLIAFITEAVVGWIWTSGSTFYADEWVVITTALDWRWPQDYLMPHNEHWVTVPRLLYRALIATVGLAHYRPYWLALTLMHLATCGLLFRLLIKPAGELVALLSALLLVFCGRGYEALVWAFEVTLVLPVLCGLGALNLIDSPKASNLHKVAAASLLTIGVMSSNVGLFFLAAVGMRQLAERTHQRNLWVVAPATLAYAAWFLGYGRAAVDADHLRLTPEFAMTVISLVGNGISASAAAVVGLDAMTWGAIAVIVGAALIGWRVRAGILPIMWSGAAGLVVEFLLIGIGRGRFGPAEAQVPRYLYVGVVFWLLMLAPAAAELTRSWLPRLIVTAIALYGIGNGALVFHDGAVRIVAFDVKAQATIDAAVALRGTGNVPLDTFIDPDNTTVAFVTYRNLYRAIDQLGLRP